MSFNLNNIGSVLQASGGPGTGVMGGKFWRQDGTDDVLYATNPADINSTPQDLTVVWWTRHTTNSLGSFSNHWAKGNDQGLQVRQDGGNESYLRVDVNNTANAGEVFTTESNVVTFNVWNMLAISWNGSGLITYSRDPSDPATQQAAEVTGTGAGAIVWSDSDYTIGCQDWEADGYRRFRGQDVIPPVWVHDVLVASDLDTIYAAKDSNYSDVVMGFSPIHFVNELDGLTDTTGLAGPTWDGSFIRRANGDKARVRTADELAASVRLWSGARL